MDMLYLGKGVATLGVCALGAFCVYVTKSKTGIGWATFGVALIWIT